jgi:serine/threonine protein kinase
MFKIQIFPIVYDQIIIAKKIITERENQERNINQSADEETSPLIHNKTVNTTSEQTRTKKSSIETIDRKYEKDFIEEEIVSSETKSLVCKSICRENNQIYAIKKVPFDKSKLSKVCKEFKIAKNLDKKFVVTIESCWIEDNIFKANGFSYYAKKNIKISEGHGVFSPYNSLLLYIQMEYLPNTLTKILQQLKVELYNSKLRISTFYYIASVFLVELLECVNYLHNWNKPIIHRDLKPENVLITDGSNGRFIKLADFGLSTFHEFSQQSHSQVGTMNYIAPEVPSQNYNTKADIYSLGAIIEEIFDVDVDK